MHQSGPRQPRPPAGSRDRAIQAVDILSVQLKGALSASVSAQRSPGFVPAVRLCLLIIKKWSSPLWPWRGGCLTKLSKIFGIVWFGDNELTAAWLRKPQKAAKESKADPQVGAGGGGNSKRVALLTRRLPADQAVEHAYRN